MINRIIFCSLLIVSIIFCQTAETKVDSQVNNNSSEYDLLNFQEQWIQLLNKLEENGYDSLSYEEKVRFNVWVLNDAIINGGFVSYFYNPDGEYAEEALKSLDAIGAVKTREMLRKVMDLFPGGKPSKDIDERNQAIDSWDDSVEDLLTGFDDTYYSREENVEKLLYEYILVSKVYINFEK